MAKKTKSPKDTDKVAEEAIEISENGPQNDVEDNDAVKEPPTGPSDDSDTYESESVDEEKAPDEPPEGEPEAAEDIPATAAPVAAEPVVVHKTGFFPMLFGGVAAAAIGFGAALYSPLSDWLGTGNQGNDLRAEIDQKLQSQSVTLEELGTRIQTLSDGLDLSGIEATQSDLSAAVESMSSRLEATETLLTTLETRLTEVEKRPLGEAASDAAVAAYERELKALQDAVVTQRAEIEAMAAGAQEMEANAQEVAQATMRRAALTRIQTALDSGTAFAAALSDLESAGVAAPEALTRVADSGVASLADLQAQFPDAARAALAVSRKASGSSDGSGGFSAFLRSQLGARSLEPQEGDDPDAILSRVEAATREGRLNDALAEIEALPETGRAELSDWAGQAARRLEAVAAAQMLGDSLN